MSSANTQTDGTIVMSGWAQQQRNPTKHMTGIVAVLVVHGVAGWLIWSDMGQKFVKKVVPKSIVEVVLPPEPPPPPPKPPEPPKQQPKPDVPPPPPTFVPPPEVAPPVSTTAPVFAATPTPPPPAEYKPAPPAPPAPPKPAGPRGFGSIVNRAACAAALNASFPREARRNSQEGSVTVQVKVGPDGSVQAAEVTNSNPRRVFDRAALGVINSGACKFEPDSAGYFAVLEISYKLSGESSD
jgi:periplasmic protein TonB